MVDYKLPQPTEPLVLPDGSISTRWYNYWRTRVENSSVSELLALIQELAAQIEELQGLNPKLTGVDSVSVLGQLLSGATVRLVGDETNPLPAHFYATDDDRAKGWNPLYPNWVPNPYADYLVDENGDYLIDENGNFLTSDDGFPINPDYLPDHDNLNGLDGGSAGEYYHLTAAEHTEVQTLTSGGTTEQLWRGDGAWIDYLTGDFGVSTATAWTGDPAIFGANGGGLYVQDATRSRAALRSAGVASQIYGISSGGTLSSPSASPALTSLFDIYASGYGTSTWGYSGLIRFATNQAHTDAARGTEIQFHTTAAGSTTLTARWRITGAGSMIPNADNTYNVGDDTFRPSFGYFRNLAVGPNSLSAGGGVGIVFIANATTVPTSNPTGGGILYVESGSLKYRGSSGTVTVLAPA